MPKWLRTLALPLLVLSIVAAACADDGGESGEGDGDGEPTADCTATSASGWRSTSAAWATSRSTTRRTQGCSRRSTKDIVCEENTEFIEADATGPTATRTSRRSPTTAMTSHRRRVRVLGRDRGDRRGLRRANFAVIDGFANAVDDSLTNVADLTFKEHEGSFLVGAAAALKCECDTIGFLGGQTGPLIEKFEAGYVAGAQDVNPDIEVLVEYIGDDTTAFNNATAGEALSTQMYDDGAEIIYHAAGVSGGGLFNAAVKADKLAIGVDSDQYLTASAEQQPLILTSMLKRVDTAVYDAITQTADGNFTIGFQVFGMAEDGVDYSKSNTDELTDEIITEVDAYKQQIIDGEITVPEAP